MKNKSIYIVGISALLLGFIIAWFIKPSADTIINESTTQKIEAEVSEDQIWTCSMHPQVRQNESGLCPICGMDLIPLESNSSNDPTVLEMTNEAVKLANIQTTTIGQGKDSQVKSIRLTGKVQADERLASSQVSHVPGRIEKLYVSFTGEHVRKGQKVVTIYSPDLINAQRELLEAVKLKELNPGLVKAARKKLKFWKIDEQTIEKIERTGEVQETFTLYADASGIVTKRRVSVGDYVQQGQALFDLMNLRRVWVLFDAYEEDLASISINDVIEFTTPSIPTKTFKTRITFIDPVINPVTRVASLRTEVSNTKGLLKPEMFVSGILQNISHSTNQLAVPKSAVLWTGTRSVVYVKLQDMTIPSYQYREIELGQDLGDSYQVLSGLESGDEVVSYGSFTIDAAAQLNNQVSMMNKNVKIKGSDNSQHLPDYTESTPMEFKQQLAGVSTVYFLLKDAFVATNSKDASDAANQLNKALTGVDMALLKGEAHLYWMEQLNALEAHSKKITELNDIEEQRKQFDFLSQSLIKSIKVFGIPQDTIYVDHCPMAFNNTGADWLSKEKIIQNPYFGDKMITCGVVKTTITNDYKNPPMEKVSNASQNIHNH